MRLTTLLLTLLLTLPAFASDYAREQRWADEVIPAALVGDPVWLQQENGHKFLGLYTEAPQAKAAILIVHGRGVHPDWNLIGTLRQRLPEMGYTTLSLQMPVLAAEAVNKDYPPTFPEAASRIAEGVAFLQAHGYKKVILDSHSLGCSMVERYLELNPQAPVLTWMAIGAPGTLGSGRLKFPILDLTGENDLPDVLEARARRTKTKGAFTQITAPGTNHFFDGHEQDLLDYERAFLERTL